MTCGLKVSVEVNMSSKQLTKLWWPVLHSTQVWKYFQAGRRPILLP